MTKDQRKIINLRYRSKNRDKAAAYYQNRREEISAYYKERNARPEVKERIKQYSKEYRKNNRDKIREYQIKTRPRREKWEREYKKREVEKLRADNAAYYAKTKHTKRQEYLVKNKLSIARKRAAYLKKNIVMFRGYIHKRRAKKLKAPIGELKLIAAWEKRIRSQPFVSCYWCKKTIPNTKINIDHIIALTRGGAHEIGNLCVSCKSCNSSKHAKTLEIWNSEISEPVLF